ncbi:unnamed protein product [Moneuplotes crassus]|uniref:Uncharacterized protein n=1 Tax=Euplotes crassus TaxID=5936 RepID=A0AAD1X1S2_EUPCR|nr:unnamed protein product [Moneuplotes crassus]
MSSHQTSQWHQSDAAEDIPLKSLKLLGKKEFVFKKKKPKSRKSGKSSTSHTKNSSCQMSKASNQQETIQGSWSRAPTTMKSNCALRPKFRVTGSLCQQDLDQIHENVLRNSNPDKLSIFTNNFKDIRNPYQRHHLQEAIRSHTEKTLATERFHEQEKMNHLKHNLELFLDSIDHERHKKINKNRKNIKELYQMKFRPRSSSSTFSFMKENLAKGNFNRDQEKDNRRGLSKDGQIKIQQTSNKQQSVRMPVMLKKSQSIGEFDIHKANNFLQNKDISEILAHQVTHNSQSTHPRYFQVPPKSTTSLAPNNPGPNPTKSSTKASQNRRKFELNFLINQNATVNIINSTNKKVKDAKKAKVSFQRKLRKEVRIAKKIRYLKQRPRTQHKASRKCTQKDKFPSKTAPRDHQNLGYIDYHLPPNPNNHEFNESRSSLSRPSNLPATNQKYRNLEIIPTAKDDSHTASQEKAHLSQEAADSFCGKSCRMLPIHSHSNA